MAPIVNGCNGEIKVSLLSLGVLHLLEECKQSLVCDFEELYRYLIDDFVIQYCQRLRKRDFTVKPESLSKKTY